MSGITRAGMMAALCFSLVAAGPQGEPERPVADAQHVIVTTTLSVAVPESGATFRFEIEAQKSKVGTGTLDNADGTMSVLVRRCDPGCDEIGTFAKALGADEFVVADDLATASLATVLFDAPVEIVWDAQTDGAGSVEATVYQVSTGHGGRVVYTQRVLGAHAVWQWREADGCLHPTAEIHERVRVDFPFQSDVPDAAEPLDVLLGLGPVGCG